MLLFWYNCFVFVSYEFIASYTKQKKKTSRLHVALHLLYVHKVRTNKLKF